MWPNLNPALNPTFLTGNSNFNYPVSNQEYNLINNNWRNANENQLQPNTNSQDQILNYQGLAKFNPSNTNYQNGIPMLPSIPNGFVNKIQNNQNLQSIVTTEQHAKIKSKLAQQLGISDPTKINKKLLGLSESKSRKRKDDSSSKIIVKNERNIDIKMNENINFHQSEEVERTRLWPQTSSVMIDNGQGKLKRSYAHIQDPAERRRVRNREVAKHSRDQKKLYVNELETTINKLKKQNIDLQAENANWKDNFTGIINASNLNSGKLEELLGSNYMDLLIRDRHESNKSNESVNLESKIKKQKSSVHVTQDFDGIAKKLTTFNADSSGTVTVNNYQNIVNYGNNDQNICNYGNVPAPVPLVSNVLPSPPGSSGYTSENMNISPSNKNMVEPLSNQKSGFVDYTGRNLQMVNGWQGH